MNTDFTARSMALEVRGLSKQYRSLRRGSNWALQDCAFALPSGRVAALVGQNGAGKTTLMSILAGLLVPTGGWAKVDGVTLPASRNHSGSRVSFVAQEKPLYRHFTAAEMLQFGAHLNRVWDHDRASRWLRRFEVPLDRPCGKLSGGQQAQVAFAVAIGARPSVLLLDEPLANLDPLARTEVVQELLAEVVETGMTVLLSTHVVAELGGVADYLLLLSDGHLLVDGDVDDLLTAHLYYAGPRRQLPPGPGQIVWERHTAQQSTFLVRLRPGELVPPISPPWTTRPASLEDLVLAHMQTTRTAPGKAAA